MKRLLAITAFVKPGLNLRSICSTAIVTAANKIVSLAGSLPWRINELPAALSIASAVSVTASALASRSVSLMASTSPAPRRIPAKPNAGRVPRTR
jgi:hypothetical protein